MNSFVKKLEKMGIFDNNFPIEKISLFHIKFCQELNCDSHLLCRHEFTELIIRLTIEKSRKGASKNDIIRLSGTAFYYLLFK